jgi:hypothetical protein
MRLETSEIVHFKTYNPDNRFVGLSPLESLAVTLRGDQAMRHTNTVTYADFGGAPQSILSFKEFVQEPAWSNVKAEVRDAAKRNEMMMLRGVGDGVSWMQRVMSNKDADFLNGLQQNMTDVFNRMCPGLLNLLSEGATYSNASAAQSTYSAMTKWPIMEVLAQKITSDILPTYGRKLIAQFEDPRYTDRAIVLQERTADENIMTVEELRREYKQLDPLGDERDGLLLAQITATTGQPEPEPAPVPTQDALNTMPMESVEDMEDTQPEPNVKALLELEKWRLKTIQEGKIAKWNPGHIPAKLCDSIKSGALTFKQAEIQLGGVKQVDSVKALADAINRAVNE